MQEELREMIAGHAIAPILFHGVVAVKGKGTAHSGAEKPEAIRDQNMVEQVSQFDVGDRDVILANAAEHRGIGVSVVADQIAEYVEHAPC